MHLFKEGALEETCIKGYDGRASDDESCIDYNMELIGASGVKIMDSIIWALIIIGLIVDILSFKYNKVANACLYIRLTIYLTKRMMPG